MENNQPIFDRSKLPGKYPQPDGTMLNDFQITQAINRGARLISRRDLLVDGKLPRRVDDSPFEIVTLKNGKKSLRVKK